MKEEINLNKMLENNIISLFYFFRRNKIILLSSFLLGTVVGIIFYIINENSHISKIIAQTNVYEPSNLYLKDFEEHVGHLPSITRNEAIYAAISLNQYLINSNKLSKKLSISINDAKQIKKFEADSVVNTNSYYIEVTYKKPINLAELEKGIVKYINSTPFISEKIETTKQRNHQLIIQIDNELAKLEQLQTNILYNTKINQQNSANLIVTERTTLFYHVDILAFNVLKQACLEHARSATAIDVSQSLNYYTEQRFSIFISLFLWMFIFIFLGISISLISDIKKKMI